MAPPANRRPDLDRKPRNAEVPGYMMTVSNAEQSVPGTDGKSRPMPFSNSQNEQHREGDRRLECVDRPGIDLEAFELSARCFGGIALVW